MIVYYKDSERTSAGRCEQVDEKGLFQFRFVVVEDCDIDVFEAFSVAKLHNAGG